MKPLKADCMNTELYPEIGSVQYSDWSFNMICIYGCYLCCCLGTTACAVRIALYHVTLINSGELSPSDPVFRESR